MVVPECVNVGQIFLVFAPKQAKYFLSYKCWTKSFGFQSFWGNSGHVLRRKVSCFFLFFFCFFNTVLRYCIIIRIFKKKTAHWTYSKQVSFFSTQMGRLVATLLLFSTILGCWGKQHQQGNTLKYVCRIQFIHNYVPVAFNLGYY